MIQGPGVIAKDMALTHADPPIFYDQDTPVRQRFEGVIDRFLAGVDCQVGTNGPHIVEDSIGTDF